MKKMKAFSKCTPREQLARWENVIRVLQALSPHERRKHWNMAIFGRRTECGTVACAAGHAGLDPWFRRRGFRLSFRHGTMPRRVLRFFGSGDVFFDGDYRSVGTVIKEIKQHIRACKLGSRHEED